jgi:hypothetical protein
MGSTIDVLTGAVPVFRALIFVTSVLGSPLAIFHVRVTERPDTSCTLAVSSAARVLALGSLGFAAAGAKARIESAAAITATAATRPTGLDTGVLGLVIPRASPDHGGAPIARLQNLRRVRVRLI